MNQTYDGPDFNVRREASFLSVAGNGGVSCRFASYQKLKAIAAHFTVVTAGTAAGHAAIVKAGTAVLGTATLGTNTAGYQASLDLGDATVASKDLLSCTNGTDATGVYHVSYEYQHLPDAAFSS